MTRFLKSVVLVVCLSLSFSANAQKIKRDLTIKINGLSNVTLYLAQYDGTKLFYRDTSKVNALGIVKFGTKPLSPGMYAIVTSDKADWFDFLVSEPKIELETDISDFNLHMKTKSSKENELFYTYQKLVNSKKLLKQKIFKGREFNKLSAEEKNKIIEHDREVTLLRRKIHRENPDKLVGLLMGTMLEPEIPTNIKKINNSSNNAEFFYLKEHYFDPINLKDDRLISLPPFQTKLDTYLDQLVFPRPDSLIKDFDFIMAKTKESSEVYQFMVTHTLKKVFANKTVGMDAVFVHIARKYCDPQKTKWMDQKKLKNLHERVNSMAPLLAGNIAPELKLPDVSGNKWISLHDDFNTEFTILYFWRPDCSSCKKVTPLIRDIYKKQDKSRIKLLAVNTNLENKDWLSYIKENNLDDFVNVSDNPDLFNNPGKYVPAKTNMGSVKFRDEYDLYSTPRIFLLDKNKKIIAKKMNPEELDEMLNILLKK